jgi:hypothetical protein
VNEEGKEKMKQSRNRKSRKRKGPMETKYSAEYDNTMKEDWRAIGERRSK